jgi:hypothetical protein
VFVFELLKFDSLRRFDISGVVREEVDELRLYEIEEFPSFTIVESLFCFVELFEEEGLDDADDDVDEVKRIDWGL